MNSKVDHRVVEVMEETVTSTTPTVESTLWLSRGVTLGFKKVPPMILAKIEEKYPDPPIPSVFNEEKGRAFPNPNHPDYLKALKDNDGHKGMAMTDVLLGMGTYLISIDEGVQTPEDTEWVEELEYIGIEVPKLKLGRYLYWLKYYVVQSGTELAEIVKRGSKALGVTEQEVASAIANFQDNEERGSDPEHPIEVQAGHRD